MVCVLCGCLAQGCSTWLVCYVGAWHKVALHGLCATWYTGFILPKQTRFGMKVLDMACVLCAYGLHTAPNKLVLFEVRFTTCVSLSIKSIPDLLLCQKFLFLSSVYDLLKEKIDVINIILHSFSVNNLIF